MSTTEQTIELIDLVFRGKLFEKRIISLEEFDLMWKGVKKLSGRYIHIFKYRFEETPRHSYKHIGNALNISESYVKRLVFLMTQWLRIYVLRKGQNPPPLRFAEPARPGA